MNQKAEVVKRDQRGRMRLTVLRKIGQYGPYYSALVYRSVKTGEVDGKPTFEDTHWLDERDILDAKRLHDIAHLVIAENKQCDAARAKDQPEAA